MTQLVLCLCVLAQSVYAQSTEFTYQGKLMDAGALPTAIYDLEFALWDVETGGANALSRQIVPGVQVRSGIFTVQLDFGLNFRGGARWLEISIKKPADATFTLLTPRQPITTVPYSIRSSSAANADSATNAINAANATNAVSATTANNVTGVVAIANGGTGSATQNFVDLSTDQTAGGNKTFTGALSGTVVNAVTQFNVGGDRTMSSSGAFNDGLSGNFLTSNVFVGSLAGGNTTPDPSLPSISGKLNSFFGVGAGQANTTGSLNSFFGFQAGQLNTTTGGNSFFGQSAGFRNTGSSNSFFGRLSGSHNTSGVSNTAVGENADFAANNATGSSNTLLGSNSRVAADTSSQTALGSLSRVDAANSAAIGFRSHVAQSNSIVLGSISGVNNCNPPFCDSVRVGIGTTVPAERLHVVGNGLFTGNLTVNGALNATLPVGSGNYIQNTTSQQGSANFHISGSGRIRTDLTVDGNVQVGGTITTSSTISAVSGQVSGTLTAGAINTSGPVQTGTLFSTSITTPGSLVAGGDTGIGTNAPVRRLHVDGTGVIRARVNSDSNAGLELTLNNQPGWSVATVTGGQFQIFNDSILQNALWIDAATNSVGIGTSVPDQLLSVNGNASKIGGGSWAVYSDARLKNIHGRFTRGLGDLMRLEPIRFEYRADNALGLKGSGEYVGFSAQAVARVVPEAVSRSDNGYLQINNDPIIWTMLNAIKEQQVQLAEQAAINQKLQEQVTNQQAAIEALKRSVCSQNNDAEVCKPQK